MNRITRQTLLHTCFAAMVLVQPFPVHAAISSGPTLTNTVAAKDRLNTQFYEAEQSYQEKLKVGRERYARKEAYRASVIAGMNSQLAAQREMVVLHPPSEADDTIQQQIARSFPWMIGLSLVASFTTLVFYLKRRGPLLAAPRCPLKKTWTELFLGWWRPYRPRYRVTAFRPITIWANAEVPKSQSRGSGRNAIPSAGWIQLQSGEKSGILSRVIGVRADCVPHGRRIFVDGADADIVPLDGWSDKELPKNFFDSFKVELTE